MRRFLPRFREPLIREPFFSRFRNCENVIEEPRERGELQAIAAVPPARQSGRVRHRRTARRERGAGEPKRGQKGVRSAFSFQSQTRVTAPPQVSLSTRPACTPWFNLKLAVVIKKDRSSRSNCFVLVCRARVRENFTRMEPSTPSDLQRG